MRARREANVEHPCFQQPRDGQISSGLVRITGDYAGTPLQAGWSSRRRCALPTKHTNMLCVAVVSGAWPAGCGRRSREAAQREMKLRLAQLTALRVCRPRRWRASCDGAQEVLPGVEEAELSAQEAGSARDPVWGGRGCVGRAAEICRRPPRREQSPDQCVWEAPSAHPGPAPGLSHRPGRKLLIQEAGVSRTVRACLGGGERGPWTAVLQTRPLGSPWDQSPASLLE